VKDLGDLELILGMRVRRDRAKCQLILDQEQYAMKVVDKFRMTNAKAESTPEASKKLTRDMAPKTQAEADVVAAVPYMQAVGSLLYASIATRPDLTHAVNEVCKFMSCYGQQHWTAVKRILRYLKGEPGLGLSYEPRHSNADGVEVCAYTDADWAGDTDDRKSTSGYLVLVDGCVVSWSSKKQSIVTLSSAEAEYVALADAAKEVLWTKNLIAEMLQSSKGMKVQARIFCDNQAAAEIAKNDVSNDRSKHIDARYHFVRNLIKTKDISVEWVPTDKQLADIFTKGLAKPKFSFFRSMIMKANATK
jgi:hypothetical protein